MRRKLAARGVRMSERSAASAVVSVNDRVRDTDRDLSSTIGRVRGGRSSSMRQRDGGHDCKPEAPSAAASALVGAAGALEGLWCGGGWETLALLRPLPLGP